MCEERMPLCGYELMEKQELVKIWITANISIIKMFSYGR